MRQSIDSQKKLIPLRKFAIPEVYSPAYLSQLVQRKKLKAKKIGRNYYTCVLWFKEYIEKHARDEKQHEFIKNYSKHDVYLDDRRRSQLRREEEVKKINIFKIFNIRLLKRIAIITAIFILLIVNIFYLVFYSDQGRVAGVSEEGGENSISTSTIEK